MSFLEDEFSSITFGELKHLNDTDLQQYISKETALKICKKSFEIRESAGQEIFHLWVHKLVRAFEGSKFTETEWQQLTEFFRKIVQQIFTPVAEDNTLQPAAIRGLLSDTVELLKWFRQFIAELGANIVCLILKFVLETVLLFYETHNKGHATHEFGKALQNALVLHSSLLQVINVSLEVLIVQNAKEFFTLTELLHILCNLCEQTGPVAIKVIVETWKCVANLTVYCLQFARFNRKEYGTDFPSWTSKPLCLLLREIQRNLNVIYNPETLLQPVQQVEKYLRVTNFYVKLLQRLANDLKHDSFPCSEEFLKTFILAKTIPTCLENSEIRNLIEKYVQIGLCDIFRVIYKNPLIYKVFTEFPLTVSGEDKSEYLHLAKEFMHAAVAEKQPIFIDDKADVIINMFQHIMKEAQHFCDLKLYNEVVELVAALAILNKSGKLKKYLRRTVLREDFLLAQASVDVLLTIAHSSHTSSSENLKNFRYWRSCNEKFALLTDNPRELHVQQLLLQYFKLCEANGIAKCELWKECNDSQLQRSDDRLFMALGLSNTCENAEALSSLRAKLSDELLELCKESAHYNVDSYYKMIVKIKLISDKGFQPKEELLLAILKLTQDTLRTSTANLLNSSKFLTAVLNLILINRETLDDEIILSTLQSFLQKLQELDNTVLLLLCALINNLHHKSIFHKVREEFLLKCEQKSCLKWFYMFNDLKKYENCTADPKLYGKLVPTILPCCNCTLAVETTNL